MQVFPDLFGHQNGNMDKIIGLQSLNLLREMVTVPSVSFEETAVADLIGSRLSAWGVVHERLRNNLVAGLEKMDPDKKTLVLDAHIDTFQYAGVGPATPSTRPVPTTTSTSSTVWVPMTTGAAWWQ